MKRNVQEEKITLGLAVRLYDRLLRILFALDDCEQTRLHKPRVVLRCSEK